MFRNPDPDTCALPLRNVVAQIDVDADALHRIDDGCTVGLGHEHADGAPDLVVEVLSPSNRAVDLIKKAALYLNYGVPEYWVVDPESESITVNVNVDGQYIALESDDGRANSSALRGFSVDPKEIFSEPAWLSSAKSEME